MPIKMTELPEYEQAHDEYVGAISAAKSAQDELAELRAENVWLSKQSKLREVVEERNDKERAIAAALEKAKADFPKVPEVLYAKLSEPEEILSAAEEASKVIDESVKGQTPRQPRQQWSAPPAAGQATPAGQKDKYNDEEYLADLNKRFARKGSRDRVEAAEEVRTEIFNRQVLPNFMRRVEGERERSMPQ